LVETYEGEHAVVYYRSAKDLPAFDENSEREHSRRYWSSAYPGCVTVDRLKLRSLRVGEITADPRTYHADQMSP
jgi:hypothetical protein